MTDIALMTATELSSMIKTKELSPVELTKHMLDRIDKLDPAINSYITTLNEGALKQAREAEDSIMQGQYKGPLHGIPMGIKDNYKTKGIRTTGGSKLFTDYTPAENATAVDKLLGAGGIMLGKMNMNEIGAGSTGINPTFGNARNPWNRDHITGGSSSGSAAALAAGLATLTTGTDTWGSCRIPPSMCGVYGLKPTYGLVSTYEIIPTDWSLDAAGPLAHSVPDLALMLNHMAGFDPNDPPSLSVSVPDYTADLTKGIKGIKIGIPTYYLEGLDPDIEELFTNAVTKLKSLGAEIKEIEIPELSLTTFAGYVTAGAEAAAYTSESLKTHPQDFGQDVRILLSAGSLSSAAQYVRAQQARRAMVKAFQKAFESVDILLGPTVPFTTPAFSENWVDQNLKVVRHGLPFTNPANLTGVPSLAVPMGVDSKGLPAGMQFIGNHLSEKLLFQIGNAWESTEPLRYGTDEIEGS